MFKLPLLVVTFAEACGVDVMLIIGRLCGKEQSLSLETASLPLGKPSDCRFLEED